MSKPKTVHAELFGLLTEEEVLEIAKEIEALSPAELDRAMINAQRIDVHRKNSMKKTRAKYEARHKLLIDKAKEVTKGAGRYGK